MGLLERIYHFHEELKGKRFPNATTLIGQFEVSPATARRDIAYLRDRLLAPLAFDPTRNGFYYTDEDFGLPFEKSPKIVFLLGMLGKIAEEAGLGSLSEVKALEQRLAQLVFPEYAELVKAIHCEWVEVETIDPLIFEKIIEATVKKQLLHISYKSPRADHSRRKLEPLRLINYQGRWYLLAFCRLREDIRIFHISRMTDVAVLPETFKRYSNDNFNEYLNSAFGIFKGRTVFNATILFTSTAAELVRHQRWHREQLIEETGEGVLLHLPVSDDREIAMKVLQYGAMARVISPETLVQRIRLEANAMAEMYRNAQDPTPASQSR
ncbi:MAG: WYL domain-containing protein [Desulfopila sp.]|jgi:predicted DNA-binding transcriptional regulator YafY|nr:WYL domain-containing protein [Desulfopila sp.]